MIKIKFKNDINKSSNVDNLCTFDNLIKKEFICKDSRIDNIIYPISDNIVHNNTSNQQLEVCKKIDITTD